MRSLLYDSSGVKQSGYVSGVVDLVMRFEDALNMKTGLRETVDVRAERAVVGVTREPIPGDTLGIAMIDEIVGHDLNVAPIARVDD